jgi:hypothetical protein
MENRVWKYSLSTFFVLCCAAGFVLARSIGPVPARTGDFGELNCTACHTGNALNAAGGTFTISGVPASYQPGQTYPITVSISKAGQARWGFQMAVRSVSSGLQAGTLATTDANTQIQVANGIQYIEHTSAGTFAGTTSGTWTVNWTAPASAQGAIRFGAAGNAANNNGTNQGDFIYTTTATSNGAALPTTALFSHMATGGGFSTSFTFVNTGSSPVNGTLILTGQDGTPLNATLAESSVGASAPGATPILASGTSLSIPPGGAKTVTAGPVNASDPTKAGWARVESSGGTLSGVATFQLVSGGKLATVAGVLSAETVDSATIPVNDDDAAGIYTGYAVANPSSTDTVSIKVVTVREDGTTAATLAPITLQPGQQIAQFFFQDPAASKTFKGTAVLIGQNAKKFSVVALVQNQGLFTAIPVTAGKASNIN